MDYNLLIALAIFVLAGGLVFGIKWAKNKGYVDKESLELVGKVTGLGFNVLAEVGFKDDPEFKRIAYLVNASFKYCIGVYDAKGEDTLEQMMVDYTLELCEDNGIEMNENRKGIIVAIAGLLVTEKGA